jgi:phosphoribosylformylglycinamidine synthase II
VTSYQIEVRAIAERHDVHAHQLLREILQLPARQLPSLVDLTTLPADSPDPATDSQASPSYTITPVLHTSQLYHLTGNLNDAQINQLQQQLLVDPVVQQATISTGTDAHQNTPTGHIVDVFFHAGVTDTLAESVIAGARMLGIDGLEHVETGHRYILDARLSEQDAHTIAKALLFNPVIQHYQLVSAQQRQQGTATSTIDVAGQTVAQESTGEVPRIRTIPMSTMSDEELMEVSRAGLLSLNIEEMRTIQQHYREQQREPTDVELETLAQTWSEHCSHKTFKATVNYREVDSEGKVIEQETIKSLIKRYLMQATEEVRPDWLVSAFVDNAGIIKLTETHDIAFKVETHNHPSAIEPFGGANTGVGGVIRDVVGVSAQPIACTDVLCFGPLSTPADELPEGVLTPRRIASGVVDGIRDYGNKMGIPTVNGAILYHPGYTYNPLVFCGCLGMLPHGSHPNNVQPGDLIVSLGGRTGRDGVHGATFSSGEMSLEINTQAGTAVQIGAPITEKKVTDVIIQARDRHLYNAITDCGAGGFSSAIGEMGAKIGARVELTKAPLKYQGLAPWEIWLSEAQERMIIAVPPQHIDELLEICAIEEVEASILGTFTGDKRLVLTYNDTIVADMDMEFLHDGLPGKTLDAVWVNRSAAGPLSSRITPASTRTEQAPTQELLHSSYTPTLLALLRHPDIASKEDVVRRYDHEVQGATVIKPIVGRSGNGPGDAAVLQPIIEGESNSKAGVVLSNGINPLYGKIDPYHMAVNAVDEALRNLTAVGGDVDHAAILDNFCWGNPTDPEQMGMLVRAVKGCYDAAVGFKTPFISGKDSLNNEYRTGGRRLPVIPTLLISAVGVIDDVTPTVDMPLKTPGNLLYLIGATRNELAGSHYAEVIDPDSFAQLFPRTNVPRVDIPRALTTMRALGSAIRQGLVRSCHDLSEGGLAVALAEMALAGLHGASLNLARVGLKDVHGLHGAALVVTRLFSETASRFLVEVTPEQLGAFERYMREHGVAEVFRVGQVTNTSRVSIQSSGDEFIDVDIDELQAAWKGGKA